MRGEVEKILNFYKDDVISLYLYGSYAVGDQIEGISSYDLFLILKNYNFSKELSLKHPPFIFTKDELLDSLDTFPIELLDIKERGKLIYGEDVLKDLEIEDRFLRNQIERELKEKLINFRRILNFEDKQIPLFIVRTYKSLTAILRAILHLKRKNKPLKRIYIYYEISNIYNLNYKMFLDIEESLKFHIYSNLNQHAIEFYKFLETLTMEFSGS